MLGLHYIRLFNSILLYHNEFPSVQYCINQGFDPRSVVWVTADELLLIICFLIRYDRGIFSLISPFFNTHIVTDHMSHAYS